MKKFKAFTLIELIVAMAVIGILMTGVVKMVEPMSATATNSAVLNNQRNVENAICSYIGENLRYASNLAIIKGGTPTNAIEKFKQMKPADKFGYQIDYTVAANEDKIHLIAFDCSTGYTYQNNTFYGRIISSVDNMGSSISSLSDIDSDGSKPLYMALGNDYYAQGDYYLDARICDNRLCLTVDSDFYYTPSRSSKFSQTGDLSSSWVNGQTKGSYELRVMSDDSDWFVFACIDSNDTIDDSLNTNQPATVTRTGKDIIYFVYTYPEDNVTNNGVAAAGTPGGDANCPTIEGMSGGAGGNGNGNNGGNSGNGSGDSGNGSGNSGNNSGGDSGNTSGGSATIDPGAGGGESGSGENINVTQSVSVGPVTIAGGITGGNGVVGVIDATENADGSVTITATDKNGYNSGTFTITKDDDGNVVYTFTVGKNWWVFSDYMGVGWKNEGESFVLNDEQIGYLESTYGISVK